MRVVTNKKRVERNRNIATYLFLATMALLVGSFVFVNYSLFTGSQPSVVILGLQALSLPLAFIMTLYSIRMTNQWARRPYPEEALEEGMKSLNKRSILYNYYHDPARHVLIAPQGVFTITTRWHSDHFEVEDDKWVTKKNAVLKLFSSMRMDGVGNPTHDAQEAAQHVQGVLNEIAPDVNVEPLIVFVNEEAELEIHDTPVPIFFLDDKTEHSLNEYLRDLNRERRDNLQQRATLPLTEEQLAAFEEKTVE